MQYANSTFDDFRLLLELERVLQRKCTLAQTIFSLLYYLRAVWFTGVVLLCKSKEQKPKYYKSKREYH